MIIIENDMGILPGLFQRHYILTTNSDRCQRRMLKMLPKNNDKGGVHICKVAYGDLTWEN